MKYLSDTIAAAGYYYGRRKRALVNESHYYRHLPLLNRDETRRFLSLFETTLLVVIAYVAAGLL